MIGTANPTAGDERWLCLHYNLQEIFSIEGLAVTSEYLRHACAKDRNEFLFEPWVALEP